MIGMDSKHCRIVKDALRGNRTVDEQTYASIAVLDDRLERLKDFDKMFSGVEFSEAVSKLTDQKVAVAL